MQYTYTFRQLDYDSCQAFELNFKPELYHDLTLELTQSLQFTNVSKCYTKIGFILRNSKKQ